MKVISYTALLYGRDYLGYAIRSVIDHVEEHHILYSPIGAHGHRTDTPCPETRDELYAIAEAAAGSKLRWHDGTWEHEGLQRDSIFEYAPDADVIVVVDADEIWREQSFDYLRDYYECSQTKGLRTLRVPMIHYWRSFWKAVKYDPAYPIRFILPKATGNEEGLAHAMINHMGYAQRSEIVHYKQLTHGHKAEWRKDIDWYAERFAVNAQHDCHPVGSEWWNPEDINPLSFMPKWMAMHPYFDKDIID